MKTKEELEVMDKNLIIDNFLNLQTEHKHLKVLHKWENEERLKLSSMLDSIVLILNNRKR